TYNASILDNLQGIPTYPTCVDSDQVIAQQLQHTCIGPNGVSDKSITKCDLLIGGTTGLGGTETFYSNTKCSQISSCAGQMSVVALNFQAPNNPNFFCLQRTTGNTGAQVNIVSCNPAEHAQLFRVTRINPGQNPD